MDETYVAAHFGKWHILGDPAEMGFDFSDGETGNKEGGFALKDEYRTRLKEDPKLTNSLKAKICCFLEQMAKGKLLFSCRYRTMPISYMGGS